MEKRIGCLIYTQNEDGSWTRAVDETKQAEILAKIQETKES